MRLINILTVILLLMTVNTSQAQDYKPVTNLYPDSVLQGKGILYMQIEPKLTATIDAYNQAQVRSLALPVTVNMTMPVHAQNEQFYSVGDYKIRKDDAANAGYRYITLHQLIEAYDHCPQYINDVVGQYPTFGDAPKRKPGTNRRYDEVLLLRQEPNPQSDFVDMLVPDGGGTNQVTILATLPDYWFEVEISYNFKYNGSNEPGVCKMSAFRETFRGYWRAACDDYGFPYLLLYYMPKSGTMPGIVKCIDSK